MYQHLKHDLILFLVAYFDKANTTLTFSLILMSGSG